MKRLKNKVFFLIWGLLSFSIVGILVFFNVQKYKEKKDNVINSLIVAMDNEKNMLMIKICLLWNQRM